MYSYSLKILQSEGKISIASTGKDPDTGKMITQTYEVEGPVMIFLATTKAEIDDELKNRCLILTVNESEKQTKAILELQRELETLDGLVKNVEKVNLIELHANIQRLLRPIHVINPFAKDLTFTTKDHRARRDQKKYLTLIRMIAF
ncbi:MAG: DNA primase, partial [Bacteroidetes bacterium]|nr:DNA primase [Bacteroidota bacterium]